MQELLIENKPKKRIPAIRPGMTVRVHQKIKEGDKERVQVFEGLVIRVGSGAGINKTFTVRNIMSGVGVEKIFPFYSPNVVKIETKKKAKIRRAKLYYMRDLQGKAARLREEYTQEEEEGEVEKSIEELAEQKAREEAEKEKTKAPAPGEGQAETAEAEKIPETEEKSTSA